MITNGTDTPIKPQQDPLRNNPNDVYTDPTQTAAQANQASNVCLTMGRHTSDIDLSRFRAGNARESLIRLKKAIDEKIEHTRDILEVKTTLFDNMVHDDLEFSLIVFHAITATDIYYYLFLFESTGSSTDRVKTASEIIAKANEVQNADRFKYTWTTDDAINPRMNGYIQEHIVREYGYKSVETCPLKLSILEGVIVNDNEMDMDFLAQVIYSNACQVFATELKINKTNGVADLNLAESVKRVGNNSLYVDVLWQNTNTVGTMGDLYRTDFLVKLVYKPNKKQFSVQELNSPANRDETICTVGGFVDAVPINTYDVNGRVATRFIPHIILTRIDLDFPTINYLMTSIVASMVMTFDKNFVYTIYHGYLTDPGALNIMAKVDNNTLTKLRGPKDNADDAINFIKAMFPFDPIVSIEIPHYNDSSNYLSTIMSLAKGQHVTGKNFITSMVNMTGGAFDKNFNPANVFNNSMVTLPQGYWISKTGKRDIRDIDLAFVLANTTDAYTINQYNFSGAPRGGSYDSYLTRVEVIAKLIGNAVITGKCTRLTFTDQFISELSRAVAATGFKVNHKPALQGLGNTYDINMLGQYYDPFRLAHRDYSFIRNEAQPYNGYAQYSTFGNRY